MAFMRFFNFYLKGFINFSLGLFLALALAAQTAAQPAPGRQEDQVLRITAARLDADQKDRVITFSGQVKAQYGDAVLHADQLQIFYQAGHKQTSSTAGQETAETSPLAALGGERIDRLVARGKVRFVQEDKVASGEEAVYYKDRDEVVLRGNPQLWRGDNYLKGETITFNLKHNRVQVDSSPKQRVEAFLVPQTQKSSLRSSTIFPTAKPRRPPQP